MFIRNHNKKALYYSAHGIILKLNPGINLIENPLFTKKELKQFFRDEISFVEENKVETPVTTKVETPQVETPVTTKVETPQVETPVTTKVETTKGNKGKGSKGKSNKNKGSKKVN